MKFKKDKVSIKKEELPKRVADPMPLPERPNAPEVTGVFQGMCLSQAKNPQWIYVKLSTMEGKIPVIIPRRLTGKLVGKKVYVEAISDSTGTSYRYVQPPE